MVKGDEALIRRLRAIKDTRLLLGQVGLLGVAEAKKLVPVRTRNLSRTIRVESASADRVRVVAGGTANVGYARYVEQGTGLYGPKRARIKPRSKKVLSWVSGGSRVTGRGVGSRRVFARSVKGRKATPYLVPGVKRAVERTGMTDTIVAAWNDAA